MCPFSSAFFTIKWSWNLLRDICSSKKTVNCEMLRKFSKLFINTSLSVLSFLLILINGITWSLLWTEKSCRESAAKCMKLSRILASRWVTQQMILVLNWMISYEEKMNSQFLKRSSPELLTCRPLTPFRSATQSTAMTFPCNLISLMPCWPFIVKSVNNGIRLQRYLIKRMGTSDGWARHLRHRICSSLSASRFASCLNPNWVSSTSDEINQWLRRIWSNFLNLMSLLTVLLNRMLCAWSSSIS